MRTPNAVLLVLALASGPALAESWTLNNPTGDSYQDEAVRLHLPVPAEPFMVTDDGKAVPYQVEEIGAKKYIWVSVSFGKGGKHVYTTQPGQVRVQPSAQVCLIEADGGYTLDNGLLGVKVPGSGTELLPPVLSVRLEDGTWIGKGYWKTGFRLTKLTATVVVGGPVFAKVRLRYDFDGVAGLDGKTPAFAVVDVALYPGQRHVTIQESHEMARGDSWEFDAAAGWGARACRCEVFGGGAGRALDVSVLPKTLKPLGDDPAAIQYRYDKGDPRLGDTLMWLIPRANQHYQDGWFFAVDDGKNLVGAIPARPGLWLWPHENKLAIKAKPTADYAGIGGPTHRGSRFWYLIVSPKALFDGGGAANYARRHVYRTLDKLLVDYVTTWPGQDDKEGFYAGAFNPLALKRGFTRQGEGTSGAGGSPMDTLTSVQVMLDPDMYGDYWHFMSPTNPNFFTDFYKAAIRNLDKLRSHPRFADFQRLAAAKVAEDVYHSITLPGGAGQECPGYMSYALGTLRGLVNQSGANAVAPDTNQRIAAAGEFLKHISQPDGEIRRFHPGGDTHPGKEGGSPVIAVPAGEVRNYATEEIPGFGVVFHNRPGTPQETYLAFKSGPNRGHYHGDQLSFHYCANAHAVAVDHHCSYKPRAGQEHMHNRVAFHTDAMPYANMDGYERVIALKTSPDADVAMGQVESERLRWVTEFPPEDWDRDYPQVRFTTPLKYRRTVVLVKNGAQDYFVLRDQHTGPEVTATYCLHVYGKTCEPKGPLVQFDHLTLFVAEPANFAFSTKDWSHTNGGLEETKGARLTVKGAQSQFITVLYPRPAPDAATPALAAIPGGVRVGADEVIFGGGLDENPEATYVTVKRGAKVLLTFTGKEINLDRFQGDIGLFVPDSGYPFGDIPDWLIRQRVKRPDWYQEVLPLGYRQK